MEWWKKAVFYQIYPRSFKDSNGDGIGDIPGILSKIPYLANLGIDAVWLNPIYQSPNCDGGYDISDYYSIQPEFGTMEDFETLVRALRDNNIRLIMDLVVNHSSDEHHWFQESRKARDNEFRQFYFWNPAKKGQPPNNWTSFFGGSAWAWDERTQEYYLHLFAEKQPDLNWETPALREAVKDIIRFWIGKGVDGFRLDVISAISKRTDFPDTDTNDFNETIRKFYSNGSRLKEFINELRQDVFDGHDLITIGEGPGITPDNALKYLDTQHGLNMIFHFGHMFLDQGLGGRFDPIPWTMREFKAVFSRWDETFKHAGWNSVFLGNHDFARMVSRWGNDGVYREQSAKLLLTLMLTMRGTPFIYMGDELGMTNFTLASVAESKDIETINGWQLAKQRGVSEPDFLAKANYAGRDNARTPMQWSAGDGAGFSTGKSWMPINSNHTSIHVEGQLSDEDSVLAYFKRLIRFRKQNQELVEGAFDFLDAGRDELFVFQRTSGQLRFTIALNFSNQPQPIALTGQKLIGNYEHFNENILAPWECRILKS